MCHVGEENHWQEVKPLQERDSNEQDLRDGDQSLLNLLSHHNIAYVVDMELYNLMFALWHFGLALISFLLFFPFVSFEMGLFSLCHFILEAFNFVFGFYRG